MYRECRYSDYTNIHRRIDSVVLHGTWDNFYSRTPTMICGSPISGQIKNVAVNIQGKTQTCFAFRGIQEVEKNIQGFRTIVPHLLRVEGDKSQEGQKACIMII